MKINKKIKIAIIMALSSFSLGSMGFAADTTSQNEQKIGETLRKSPFKTLIVFCGKNPYNWQSSSEKQGQVNFWEIDPDKGNHDHPSCLTLAESADVEPDILWDWTVPIPDCMEKRFEEVYLEKAPPKILDLPICMINLFRCLEAGGKGYFDHQIRTLPGTQYELKTPFSIEIPPVPEEIKKKIDILKASEQNTRIKFNTIANIDPTATMTKKQFEELILNNSELEKLNQMAFICNQQFSQLQIQTMKEQMTVAIQKFRQPAFSLTKTYMEGFGFREVKVEAGIDNPFNQRKNSTLVFVTKPQ